MNLNYDFRIGHLIKNATGEPVMYPVSQMEVGSMMAIEVLVREAAIEYAQLNGLTFVGAVSNFTNQWYTRRVYQHGRLIWRDGRAV